MPSVDPIIGECWQSADSVFSFEDCWHAAAEGAAWSPSVRSSPATHRHALVHELVNEAAVMLLRGLDGNREGFGQVVPSVAWRWHRVAERGRDDVSSVVAGTGPEDGHLIGWAWRDDEPVLAG